MKKQSYLILIAFLLITTAIFESCKKDFLTRTPLGSLSQDVLATPSGIKGLLVGAYAALDGLDLGGSNP